MESYKRLLLANQAWAKEKAALQPGIFDTLARGQNPDFLWIGCSDSRVPAEEITGVQPGDIFVHRNIANLFVAGDINASSVVEYAVDYLKVKHIIVCGHYGCGGVRAALSNESFGGIDNWLIGLRATSSRHHDELDRLPGEQKVNRLVELSVKEQIGNLAKSEIIQRAWGSRQAPLLHGWVFGLGDGMLRPLTMAGPGRT